MPLNTQTMGRVLSVQKILVGGIEQTPEGAVADGKVTQYMLIRGSTGNDAIVDSNGNLVCMLKGDQNLPIAQDAAGNLVAVMKGDYAGALKTWKVDSVGRGEMFINDPQDARGNVITMGLGEHAVRTHAPPMTFDRRGDVIFWDDFEHDTPKYIDVAMGGVINRSNDTSSSGAFSMKCIAGTSLVDFAGFYYILSDFHACKTGIQLKFATADSDIHLYIMSSYYDGTKVHRHRLRWRDDGLLEIERSDGSYVQISSTAYYDKSIHNFGTVKLMYDLADDKYDQLLLFGSEYDISGYTGQSLNDATPRSLYIEVYFGTAAMGVYKTSYVDNIIVTEN